MIVRKTICKPRHWNLSIGIGIGTDITNVIISSSIRPMDPQLSRVVTQGEKIPPTKSCDSSISRSRGKIKRYIFTFARPIYPKLRNVVTQDEGTPPTKSCDTSTTWSCDNSKTLYLHFHKAYGPQTYQDTGYSVVTLCGEGDWLIQASTYFHPSLSKEYNISNVKEAVRMQRKACACRK